MKITPEGGNHFGRMSLKLRLKKNFHIIVKMKINLLIRYLEILQTRNFSKVSALLSGVISKEENYLFGFYQLVNFSSIL